MYKIKDKRLTVQSVKFLYTQVIQSMSLTDNINIDLSGVEYMDTAGLAMILAWWQFATANDIVCCYKVNDLILSSCQSYQIELP
jgi:anti-anti-sigma regulatory factor